MAQAKTSKRSAEIEALVGAMYQAADDAVATQFIPAKDHHLRLADLQDKEVDLRDKLVGSTTRL